MILSTTIIVCDNEHGTGDVTFPELDSLISADFQLPRKRAKQLREEAKKSGWGRHAGGDYCPSCMESGL